MKVGLVKVGVTSLSNNFSIINPLTYWFPLGVRLYFFINSLSSLSLILSTSLPKISDKESYILILLNGPSKSISYFPYTIFVLFVTFLTTLLSRSSVKFIISL
uniref:Orf c04033 protein n=1 Tax=Saccharolobus solfataricus TaxID=2287 RepID=P95971_SACSO|nr:orf c04033 [Saccharolobus solfataricus P2]